MWVDAAGQMFFSLSVCFGGIIMFGSYNKFRNNIYAYVFFLPLSNIQPSLLSFTNLLTKSVRILIDDCFLEITYNVWLYV